jgi:hypothetical protein
MNTFLEAVIVILTFIAVALVGQYAVQKTMEVDVLAEHHSAGEAMMGVAGTLFSVLLGFMIAAAMQTYNDARMYGTNEASNVASIFRISKGLSDTDRPRIRQLCRDYVDDVISVEWPQMANHEKVNHGWMIYSNMWDAVVAMVPENDRQANLEQSLVDTIKELGENRRSRILLAQKGMPMALWWVIGVGALATLSLSYVFASRFPKVQAVMTTLVATAMALNIWLLSAYSHPYSGELRLEPSMFLLLKDNVLNAPDTPSHYLHDTPQ